MSVSMRFLEWDYLYSGIRKPYNLSRFSDDQSLSSASADKLEDFLNFFVFNA